MVSTTNQILILTTVAEHQQVINIFFYFLSQLIFSMEFSFVYFRKGHQKSFPYHIYGHPKKHCALHHYERSNITPTYPRII